MSTIFFYPHGANETRAFGLSPRERAERFARRAELVTMAELPSAGPVIIADLDFAWDPAWLRYLKNNPGAVLTLQGRAVLASVPAGIDPRPLMTMIASDAPLPAGYSSQALETGITFSDKTLRKREQPYLMPLRPDTADAVERASYDGAYKGVTDLLTAYLWRGAAFHLTRWAARLGLSPNIVTAVGAFLCVLATWLFYEGRYWEGFTAGFIFMVLDTVDGKLARCTGTTSKWGDFFDHGVDLVHPPFWWLAWGLGLASYGTPLADGWFWPVQGAIWSGYVLQRLIEGLFLQRFAMDIHIWERFDSHFRLITARRNPNMLILFFALLAGRPDIGLLAVAVWTLLSLVIHAIRMAQALLAARDRPVISWLG